MIKKTNIIFSITALLCLTLGLQGNAEQPAPKQQEFDKKILFCKH